MFKQSVLAVAVATAMAVGVAQAESIAIDVGAAGSAGFPVPDANTVTELFDSMQFFANTTTIQYDDDGTAGLSVGDSFSDSGNANITGPIPSAEFEGINFSLGGGATWAEITVAWSDLNGVLAGATGNGFGGLTFDQQYTSGTFNFYYDEPGNIDYGATTASGDDTGADDGLLVLTLTLDPSVLSNGNAVFDGAGNFLSGSSHITTTVTYALPGFWLMNGTDDFADLLLNTQIILGFIDQNTNHVSQVACTLADGEDCLFRVFSDHDGSIEFATRSVPVPGTVGLLGGALLALGGMGLARRRKA